MLSAAIFVWCFKVYANWNGVITGGNQICLHLTVQRVPYFFAYKTVFFSFQNNPKNLDPSYKTDLDLWDCLGRVKPVQQQNCIGLI